METDVLEQELYKVFEKTKKDDTELLMNILTLIVFDRYQEDIGRLYKILGMDLFSKLIDNFSDKSIRFPDKKEFKEALMLAIVYYYKEIKHFTWEQIQNELKYEKDVPLRFGKRVASVNRTIKDKLHNLINDEKDSESYFFH